MKSFKTPLSSAMAAALGLAAAGPAQALNPDVTPDVVMSISGASAQDNQLQTLLTELCLAGSDIDIYSGGKFGRAVFCEVDNSKITTGTLSITNPKVLFLKRSAGGSAQGVQPVAEEASIGALQVSSSTCTEDAPGANTWTCSVASADQISLVPDVGVSDVEPDKFRGINTPAGFSGVSQAQVNRLQVTSTSGLVFGITVNEKLRDALQHAQGLTVGAEDEANMPSLSTAQVSSILAGRVRSWAKFYEDGTDLVTTATAAGLQPSSPLVRICRRVDGSGTGATINMKFLNNPCVSGAPALATAALSNPFLGPLVTENSGSGDLETCQATADANNQWSIGLQSLEKNASGSKPYRFVKVDEVAPTLANAANGSYKVWVENSIQWRKSPAATPLAGDKLVLAQQLAADLGNVSVIASANTSYVHGFGQSGYLALASNGNTASATGEFDPATPVTPYSHALGTGGSPNVCRVPAIINNNAAPL